MTVANNNLAYPLLKDTLSVLGSSRCKVLSVLDLKDTFHSLKISKKNPNDIVESYHILVVLCIFIKECLWD